MQNLVKRRSDIELIASMIGTLGLEIALEHQPALILLDLHLPDLHGSEVLQRLRREPRTREIPVVVLSADASEREERRILASGASAYLTRPLMLSAFLAVFDEVLVGGSPSALIDCPVTDIEAHAFSAHTEQRRGARPRSPPCRSRY